jgi:hypothetical protein
VAQDADKLLVIADGVVEAFGRRQLPADQIDGKVATLRQKGGPLVRMPAQGVSP